MALANTTSTAGSSSLSSALAQLRIKLLDLTGRNRLINFKHTAGKSLQFVEGQPSAVYEKLTESSIKPTISILGLPEPLRRDWIEQNGRLQRPEPREWARSQNISTSFDIGTSVEAGAQSNIRALMYPDDLAKHCRKIEREASYVKDGYAAYSASGMDGKLDYFDYDRIGIVLSAIGAKCGKSWLARGQWSCIKNTIRFWSSSDKVSTEFLFIATEGQEFWPRRGAAQPFISQGDAQRKEILIPDDRTMRTFSTIIADTLKQISVFESQIQNLRCTRDLLLPRLLSGQIDVSNLPESVPT